jgi:hypothetical protein
VAAAAIAARSPAPPDPITRTFVVRVRYGVVIGIASIPRYDARVVTTPRDRVRGRERCARDGTASTTCAS